MKNINSCIGQSVNRYIDFINDKEEYLYSTFNDLDKVLYGFRPGQLSVISSIPGVGKTAFVLSMLYRMSFLKFTSVEYITTESKIEQISDRLIQIAIDKDLNQIKAMKDLEFRELCEKKLLFDCMPFDINSTLQPLESYEDICNKIIRLVKEKNVECVCIDNLQGLWLKDRTVLPNEENELKAIVYDLKRLAVELNIHIFLVSNMMDPGIYSEYYSSQYFTKWMDQSGDNNACSQVSDVFILLDRPEVYDIYEDSKGNDLRGILKVNVIKNRNGESGKVNLRFRSGRVTEISITIPPSPTGYMNDIINEDGPF